MPTPHAARRSGARRVSFRYCDRQATVTSTRNPNGSLRRIAASHGGRAATVLAHAAPERMSEPLPAARRAVAVF